MTAARWSLAARHTAWYAGTAFLLVAGAAALQYRILVRSLVSEDHQLLREGLSAASAMPAGPAQGGVRSRLLDLVVRRLDAACHAEFPAPAVDLPPPACGSAGADGSALRSWRASDGRLWRSVSAPARPPAVGWIEVLLDCSGDDQVLQAYREQLVVVLGLSLGVAFLFGYGVARRGLRPLAALRERIHRIDARSLDQRLGGTDQPAEIAALVSSFDAMLERLAAAFRALGEVSADLAHEIRTPLHLLRQQAEVALSRVREPEAYREILEASLEELERLRRMTDDMLFLARTEDPRAVIERRRLNVGRELGEVAEYLEAMATERAVTLDIPAPGALEVEADRTLLRRALVNLVTNALRHTPAGGRVSLRSRRDGPAVAIDVEDTGEGIPAEVLPRVFDRHFRAPADRAARPEGSGLGLAIVRGIMHLHGGSVAITSTPQHGTHVLLAFPDSTAAPDRVVISASACRQGA